MAYNKKSTKEKAHKAYYYEGYPNEKQKVLIHKTCGCSRFIYNSLLADKTAYYKETGKTLHKKVSEYKKKHEFLKEVDSLALANAKINLEKAFKNFFDPEIKAKYPTFHKKGTHDSYTTNRLTNKKGNENICITDKGLKLPKLGVVKIKQHLPIGKNETIKSVTVSIKAGRYFFSVLVEYDPIKVEPIKATPDSKVIGIDYSSPSFYIDSEGYSPEETKFFRRSEKKLAKEQHKLSKKKKGSKNYNKQKEKIQKTHLHIANQRKDFAYKEAKKLTDNYDVICFEDLNLSNLKKSLHLGKSTSDNGFGTFRNIVERKCKEKGKLFIKIDKYYPSSKRCNHCGYINKDLTLNDREWICPECHNHIDRDINAAKNIRDEGLRIALAI